MDVHTQFQEAITRMPEFIVGGAPCLDFANTVEPRGGPDPARIPVYRPGDPRQDYLLEYPDLVAWGHIVGLIPEADAFRLIRTANAHSDHAARVVADALQLREAIFHVYLAIARSEPPPPTDLTILEDAYRHALANAHITPTPNGFTWTWRDPESDPTLDLDRPLWPAARSAIDLLTVADPRRIKFCPGVPGSPLSCLWLFHDTSKSRTRRWCTMSDCGGHVKAQRLTARRRAARTS